MQCFIFRFSFVRMAFNIHFDLIILSRTLPVFHILFFGFVLSHQGDNLFSYYTADGFQTSSRVSGPPYHKPCMLVGHFQVSIHGIILKGLHGLATQWEASHKSFRILLQQECLNFMRDPFGLLQVIVLQGDGGNDGVKQLEARCLRSFFYNVGGCKMGPPSKFVFKVIDSTNL